MKEPVKIERIEEDHGCFTFYNNKGLEIFVIENFNHWVEDIYKYFSGMNVNIEISHKAWTMTYFVKKENLIYSRPMREGPFDSYFDLELLKEAVILSKLR